MKIFQTISNEHESTSRVEASLSNNHLNEVNISVPNLKHSENCRTENVLRISIIEMYTDRKNSRHNTSKTTSPTTYLYNSSIIFCLICLAPALVVNLFLDSRFLTLICAFWLLPASQAEKNKASAASKTFCFDWTIFSLNEFRYLLYV